jgi:hypothetical protein
MQESPQEILVSNSTITMDFVNVSVFYYYYCFNIMRGQLFWSTKLFASRNGDIFHSYEHNESLQALNGLFMA